MRSNGCGTACIGKWHLGFHQPFLPRLQGFDHYFGALGANDNNQVTLWHNREKLRTTDKMASTRTH